MPAAGHMVHMPAHIFAPRPILDAAENNRRAVAADQTYIARCKPAGIYPHDVLSAQHSLSMVVAMRAGTPCRRARGGGSARR